jgi:hypothetical protein
LFVTTSLGTKWESYSQALIERGYPSHKRIVIDGTRDWSPLGFLGAALCEDSDYTIHVDEDCFLYDPDQLDRLISRMEEDEEIVLAGTPDRDNYYRDHNPYACNLFFLVFKTEPIRRMMESCPEWESLKFKESFKLTAGLDPETFAGANVQYDDFEPYYGFFWMIFESNKKISYLTSRVHPVYRSTDVFIDDSQRPLARHMWYLRSWQMTELDPYEKIPNRERYLAVEKDILSSFGHEKAFSRALATSHLTRQVKGAVRRIARLPQRAVRKASRAMRRLVPSVRSGR